MRLAIVTENAKHMIYTSSLMDEGSDLNVAVRNTIAEFKLVAVIG